MASSAKTGQQFWKYYWNNSEALNRPVGQQQVGRTRYGHPVDEQVWNRTCNYIGERLVSGPDSALLDLCCGNGVLEKNLVDHFADIVAVDYSDRLLSDFVIESEKITKIHADVTKFQIEADRFDSVVLYFAAQHFDEITLTDMVGRVYAGLRKGGKLFIGDIPDINKRWKFYSSNKNRKFFFESLSNGDPHIGYWHDPEFFRYCSEYFGFSDFASLAQPSYQINSTYRFDVVFEK